MAIDTNDYLNAKEEPEDSDISKTDSENSGKVLNSSSFGVSIAASSLGSSSSSSDPNSSLGSLNLSSSSSSNNSLNTPPSARLSASLNSSGELDKSSGSLNLSLSSIESGKSSPLQMESSGGSGVQFSLVDDALLSLAHSNKLSSRNRSSSNSRKDNHRVINNRVSLHHSLFSVPSSNIHS